MAPCLCLELEDFKISQVNLHKTVAQITKVKQHIRVSDVEKQFIVLHHGTSIIDQTLPISIFSSNPSFLFESKTLKMLFTESDSKLPTVFSSSDENLNDLRSMLDEIRNDSHATDVSLQFIEIVSSADRSYRNSRNALVSKLRGYHDKILELFCGLRSQNSSNVLDSIEKLKLNLQIILESFIFVTVTNLNTANLGSNLIDLEVSYFIEKAGWAPEYVYKVHSNIADINCYALMQQKSGDNWDQAKINLMEPGLQDDEITDQIFCSLCPDQCKNELTDNKIGSYPLFWKFKTIQVQVKFAKVFSQKDSKASKIHVIFEDCSDNVFPSGNSTIVSKDYRLSDRFFPTWKKRNFALFSQGGSFRFSESIPSDEIALNLQKNIRFEVSFTFQDFSCPPEYFVVFQYHQPIQSSPAILIDPIEPTEYEILQTEPNLSVCHFIPDRLQSIYFENYGICYLVIPPGIRSNVVVVKWLITPVRELF